MGRFKTDGERSMKLMKRQEKSESTETKLTAKDWRALHRDKRAMKVMSHLDKMPKFAAKKNG